jgi:dihydroneopterin aldolase
MDKILIQGLRVDARVGVTPEERARPQTLAIDVEISADLERASESDLLEDTIDYDATTTAIAELVRGSDSRTLEHLAGRIVAIFDGNELVHGVTVEIAKQPPPVTETVDSIAVRIERVRG